MLNLSRSMRLRLDRHAWALIVLVIVEGLINFLWDNPTIGRLTLRRAPVP